MKCRDHAALKMDFKAGPWIILEVVNSLSVLCRGQPFQSILPELSQALPTFLLFPAPPLWSWAGKATTQAPEPGVTSSHWMSSCSPAALWAVPGYRLLLQSARKRIGDDSRYSFDVVCLIYSVQLCSVLGFFMSMVSMDSAWCVQMNNTARCHLGRHR